MREAIAGDFIAYRGNAGRDCRVARERATPRFAASRQLASAAAGKIESTTGVPVDVSQLSASWQNFGPTLDVRDINASLKDGGHLKIKRVTRRWTSGKACCICAGSFAISPLPASVSDQYAANGR